MNSDNFIERKDLRDECVDRVEVLQKVKALVLIPQFDCMTIKQVADFYEVDSKTVWKCYERNTEEIAADGVTKLTPKLAADIIKRLDETKCRNEKIERKRGHVVIDFGNGIVFDIPNAGVNTFSKRAIMRIGMLLRDSRVAQELRTQLLNIVEHAEESAPEILTQEIDEETKLQIELGRAVMSGDTELVMKATSNILAYKNRHIDRLKEANEQAEIENKTLAGDILRITNRKELVRAVRCLSSRIKATIPATWNILYKQLLYKFGISLKSRKTADSHGKCRTLIDYIRSDEWVKVQMTISAILKENHINPAKFYDEVFDKYYIKTSSK